MKKIKYYINKIRCKISPTIREKEVARYLNDGGDDFFRFDFELNEESIVFDLGGYKGQWASDIYSKYNCNIYVFEPVKIYCKKIQKRFEKNNKIVVFPIALSKETKTELVAINDDGTSLFKKNSTMEAIDFEDVQIFLEHSGIQKIDLMKINIEGGEYDLLDRLIETGIINKISFLHIQFHDFVPNSYERMNHIKSGLNLTHDNLLEYKFVWENWRLK
jgi:FkbM family methyltransferase